MIAFSYLCKTSLDEMQAVRDRMQPITIPFPYVSCMIAYISGQLTIVSFLPGANLLKTPR